MELSGKRMVVFFAVIALAYYWQAYIKRGPMCNCHKNMEGKTVLITGGNTGVGKATAIEFAAMGANVIIASRNMEKTKQAVDEIIQMTQNKNIRGMYLDLADFASVRKFADDFIRSERYLDVLVNNAGVLGFRGLTSLGYNPIFTINHLGHFLLTHLLLNKMKQQSSSRPARIINLTSEMYKFASKIDYDFIKQEASGIIDTYQMYATSKLAIILSTAEFNLRYQQHNITAYAVNPGVIETDIEKDMPYNFDKINWFFLKLIRRPVVYGAQTVLHCSLEDVEQHSGKYFQDCHQHDVWENALDHLEAKKLYDFSLEVTGLK